MNVFVQSKWCVWMCVYNPSGVYECVFTIHKIEREKEGGGNYNTLQHTATHHNTLQHTATHCNTLHHTATQRGCGVAHCFSLPLLSDRALLSTCRALLLENMALLSGNVAFCRCILFFVLRFLSDWALLSACRALLSENMALLSEYVFILIRALFFRWSSLVCTYGSFAKK